MDASNLRDRGRHNPTFDSFGLGLIHLYLSLERTWLRKTT